MSEVPSSNIPEFIDTDSYDKEFMRLLKHTSALKAAEIPIKRVSGSFYGKTIQEYIEGDNQIRVLASLVPDEIIYNIDNNSVSEFDCSLLAGDVKGFTDLTEVYGRSESGASKVTQVLNSFIGSMVQEIMSHGGDILKFSGDAFIVVFKRTETLTMRDAVHEAIDCGLIIQKNHGHYRTDVGIVIRVKLLVSAGTITFAIIGENDTFHYLEVGPPIWDLKAAEKTLLAGELLVCYSAWRFVNPNDYHFTKEVDTEHVKVEGVSQTWRLVQRQYKSKASFSTATGTQDTTYLIRPAVDYAVRKNMQSKLKKFIITQIKDALEADLALDYITEVRHVTVAFFNVVISTNLQPKVFLKVSDRVFRSVLRRLKKFQGEMNKMNAFDKDLIILTIFGLRGYRDGNEAARALQCAWHCYNHIRRIKYVKSVSIGVCSGETYCGAFGHTLRKEYTVISKIVNMAARLMMAYKETITCDRVTLLISKFDLDFFKLREYIHLKGVASPGPIYEYKYFDRKEQINEFISKFPILGRDDEISIFLEHLKEARKKYREISSSDNTNILIIRGPALIGKNRLLEEYIWMTPKDLPMNILILNKVDIKDIYSPIQYLFLPTMGLSRNATTSEKQNCLKQRLNVQKYGELFWHLNPVFHVEFHKPKSATEPSFIEKRKIILDLVIKLAYSSFITLWVIHLSPLRFVPEESWRIILALSKLNLFFLVARSDSTVILRHEDINNVKCVELEPLDKLYIAPMICQYLNVRGISLELERFIRNKCSGTPGYLQNLVCSLVQAREVLIKSMSRKQAYEQGLIMPAEYFFRRLMQPKRTTIEMQWKMYDDCYKKNTIDVETMGNYRLKETYEYALINVVVINNLQNLRMWDMYGEEQYKANCEMMQICDSFNGKEQIISKVGSVLSYQFTRQELVYVMHSSNTLDVAEAIKSLFEKKVLSCAHGDFLDGHGSSFKKRIQGPDDSQELKCDCRGIIIEDCNLHLPKYASCGYMQFRHHEFRKMCYQLLTDKQRKEFHHRAIRFLQLETRKCKACGQGYLAVGFMKKERLVKKIKKSRKLIHSPLHSLRSVDSSFPEDPLEYIRPSTNLPRTLHSIYLETLPFDKKSVLVDSSKSGSYGSILTDLGMQKEFLQHTFSVVKKIKRDSKTQSFSDFDFTDCKCQVILISMYSNLIYHYKGLEDLPNIFESMMQYVNMCLDSKNEVEVVNILAEAMELLENPNFVGDQQKWMVDLKRGKLYTFYGRLRMDANKLDEAHNYFMKALNCYGFPFPTENSKIRFNVWWQNVIHWYRLHISTNVNWFYTIDSIFNDDLSECLQHLSALYLKHGDYLRAELASSWGLNRALDAHHSFINLCNAYTHDLGIRLCRNKKRTINCLEINALQLTKMKRNFDKRELKAIANLLSSIMCIRIFYGNMTMAYEIGHIVWNIAKATNSKTIILKSLPVYFYSLIILMKYSELFDCMNDIYIYANEDTDNTGLFDYYTVCLILLLETGYSTESVKDCITFSRRQSFNLTLRDPNSRQRFYVLIWNWFVRRKLWSAAKIWEEKTSKFNISKAETSIHSLVTYYYKVEASILMLVNKMDKRNIVRVKELRANIDVMLKRLENRSKTATILKVRAKYLRIYYRLVVENSFKALDDMSNLKEMCIAAKGEFHLNRFVQNEKFWMNKLTASDANVWFEKCDFDKVLDYGDFEEGKTAIFVAPLPLYV